MSAPPLDTSAAVADLLRRRLLARSGGDRVTMAAKMFATAKALATSRALDRGVSGEVDTRLAVLAQLYGEDLSPGQYAAIRARFSAQARRR